MSGEEQKVNKYQTRAKVYALRSYQTNDIFIGTTCDTLPKRLYGHKNDFHQYNSKFCVKNKWQCFFDMMKFDDVYIDLIEMYPCNNKMELTRRAGEIIRNSDNAINKRIGRSQRQYKIDNAEKLKEQQKQYYEKNKDQLKQYRIDNKDKIKERQKQYTEKNKDKISERNNQKYNCILCGGKYTRKHKAQHEKSMKHQNFIINSIINKSTTEK